MKFQWEIIKKFFEENKNFIVKHHLESYNDFFNHGIHQIFRENNPIRFFKEKNPETKLFKYNCDIYLGGRDGTQLYYGKPVIYDNERMHVMYPNEARLRNMTYGFTIHYDVFVEFTIYNDEGKEMLDEFDKKYTLLLEKILLGRFPIMLQSNLCVLNNLSKKVRFYMGECRNDPGGYFIISGKEKVIISQEKFANAPSRDLKMDSE